MKVYLAGQPSEYDKWKESFREVKGFDFYDPEIDSDQSSSDTFFPQDLKAVSEADILMANPGLAPSEGTWIEIGYFLALNTEKPGDRCNRLIIIWDKERIPWSIEFVKKAGIIVSTVEEAINKLEEIRLEK
ncbi:MAG TPA: hypothetical protein PLV59_02000 [Candidatus Dojkabacteria bacterium]|nr:hypothetical protein [Candidatus Dojkabacteria bacterium]